MKGLLLSETEPVVADSTWHTVSLLPFLGRTSKPPFMNTPTKCIFFFGGFG
jgi:hypothetical protein